jgi:hypothetical protein
MGSRFDGAASLFSFGKKKGATCAVLRTNRFVGGK